MWGLHRFQCPFAACSMSRALSEFAVLSGTHTTTLPSFWRMAIACAWLIGGGTRMTAPFAPRLAS